MMARRGERCRARGTNPLGGEDEDNPQGTRRVVRDDLPIGHIRCRNEAMGDPKSRGSAMSLVARRTRHGQVVSGPQTSLAVRCPLASERSASFILQRVPACLAGQQLHPTGPSSVPTSIRRSNQTCCGGRGGPAQHGRARGFIRANCTALVQQKSHLAHLPPLCHLQSPPTLTWGFHALLRGDVLGKACFETRLRSASGSCGHRGGSFAGDKRRNSSSF